MEIKKELIDELLEGYQKPEDVIGENGLLKQLTKALLERAMHAQLTVCVRPNQARQKESKSSASRKRFRLSKLAGAMPP